MFYILTYLLTCYAVGLTPVQTLELNSLSNKLRDLEKRFEQLVASRKHEDGKQFQLVELQRQVELIQNREMKLSQAFRAAQRQQSLEASRVQRLTLRNRDVRTAEDTEYKGKLL